MSLSLLKIMKEKQIELGIKRKFDKSRFNDSHYEWYKLYKWKKLREKVFKIKGYLCYTCKAMGKLCLAHHVDHIKPFRSGKNLEQRKALFWDINNLRPICRSCHSRVSNYQRKEYKNEV